MNDHIKKTLLVLFICIISPVILIYKLISFFDRGDQPFASFSQLFSLIPGKTGNYLRLGFYIFSMKKCGDDTVISFLTLLSQKDTVIESGVYIGPNCNIGLCKIKQNTLLGSGVHVMSGRNQHYSSDIEIPIKDQGGVFKQITIGEDCWIGNSALIMADVGHHSIIGAGSIVAKPIPPYSIAVGNPAKIIQSRKPSPNESH